MNKKYGYGSTEGFVVRPAKVRATSFNLRSLPVREDNAEDVAQWIRDTALYQTWVDNKRAYWDTPAKNSQMAIPGTVLVHFPGRGISVVEWNAYQRLFEEETE